jgi:hypothetical protein
MSKRIEEIMEKYSDATVASNVLIKSQKDAKEIQLLMLAELITLNENLTKLMKTEVKAETNIGTQRAKINSVA